MQLYDGKTSIDWVYDGHLTPSQMKKNEKYAQLFDEPCVLYDNGAGEVYNFAPLSALVGRWQADGATAKEQFQSVLEKMNAPDVQITTEDLTKAVIDLASNVSTLFEAVADLGMLFSELANQGGE